MARSVTYSVVPRRNPLEWKKSCLVGIVTFTKQDLSSVRIRRTYYSIFKFWKQQDQPSLVSVITMRTALTGASGLRIYA